MAERYLWPPFGKVHRARGLSKTVAACGVVPKSVWISDTPPPIQVRCKRCWRQHSDTEGDR